MSSGTLKKHRASYAAEGARLWYDNYNNIASRNASGAYKQGIRCPLIKALDGTEWHYIHASRGASYEYPDIANIAGLNESSFCRLTAYASEEDIHTWNIDNWELVSIGSIQQSQGCMFNDSIMQQIYTLNILNNTQETITVRSIKFTKSYCLCSSEQYNYQNGSTPYYTSKVCLAYSYYLDEPIELAPNEEHTMTVKFSPAED